MIDLRTKKYFYFTQNSLKTFKECPFKFKKRYIDNIKWETSSSLSPKIEFGLDFHKIAERYFLNIPVFEESFKENEILYKAFVNLKEHIKIDNENQYYPEYTIRFADNDVRIEANLDLLIVKPGGYVEIWDFKTNANINKAEKYSSSLQTVIYLYSLGKTLEKILGFSTSYDKIKMIYYNPENDLEITTVNYNEEMYEANKKYIGNLIEEIFNYDYSKFNRNNYIRSCEYCEFNLFCDLKKNALNEFAIDLNWDEIGEVM